MAQTSSRSVIIVGGGITGLTIAVALQASGHKVTVIARDAPEDTASGVAAGMIAPAMEAMNDPDPAFSFERLKTAQQAWQTLAPLWPQSLQFLWPEVMEGHSYFIWPEREGQGLEALRKTRAVLAPLSEDLHNGLELPESLSAVRVAGDGNVSAMDLLQAFEAHLRALEGILVRGAVMQAEAGRVLVDHIGWVSGDEVVIAAGYDSHVLGVGRLSPIKGHLLDVTTQRPPVVLRGQAGYLATRTDGARFGATMQAGQSDTDVEPEVVADLKRRAHDLFPDIDLTGAVPRTGIRASTPDEWPLIGRDPASGVLVATGMRRNGYIFAPLAAQIILALVEGRESPDGGIYRPDRFAPGTN
ncbi:MAG: FAD-dependent oxidoreductase [Asticcacaulis sp.]|uniref:NAD(P)/FAD-dependent oxidoreductase n=1 Tax=Asticcacaulis sp. TaxID=1872648 RepID=UPI0039E34102